jgi:hypothetical protein
VSVKRVDHGVRRERLTLPTGAVLRLVMAGDLEDPERQAFETLLDELEAVARRLDRAELEALLVLARAAAR